MAKRRRPRVKWGRIGPPGSEKRKRWMRRMRAARKHRVLKRTVSGNHTKRRRRKRQ